MTATFGNAAVGSIHGAAYEALMVCGLEDKLAAVASLQRVWRDGDLSIQPDWGAARPARLEDVGRPERPLLVLPQEVPRRRGRSTAAHLALLHAIAHIEFNAINLALDCVYRFVGLPTSFYDSWIRVAAEEASHFALMRQRIQALGHDYGDLPAHNGLWEMACRTADDCMRRMALVPRVLEARGLDATPPMIAKLRQMGDEASVAVLEIILRDEVGHVALGDYWFRVFCGERGLEPEATYLSLMRELNAPWPVPPLNHMARRKAGFGEGELAMLSAAGRGP